MMRCSAPQKSNQRERGNETPTVLAPACCHARGFCNQFLGALPMTTDKRIAEITERRKNITPGPWEPKQALNPTDGAFDYGIGAFINDKRVCIAEAFGRVDETVYPPARENADFIAHAPDDIDFLLSELARVTAERVNAEYDRGDILERVATLTRERDAAREALSEIRMQKLSTEMTRDEYEMADFIGGYDACICAARAIKGG
jgi:hypothetical protein